MTQKDDDIDWGRERWRSMIVEQRKFLWLPDAIKKYAAWMGLKPGMTAVDVGCGLAYLGYTYWSYFGHGGKYIGIDQSEKLLSEAAIGAKEWAQSGDTEFKNGDAYNLPIDDKAVDWVMCQTLLMHLNKPEEALREMIRILKPGGLLMCKEPDNLSGSLARHFFSAYNFSHDDYCLNARVMLLIREGRLKLGRGDMAIGVKIPNMLGQLGMKQIDIRMNEKVFYLQPPYDNEEQRHRLKEFKEEHLESDDRDYWFGREKEEFLAGGGNINEYKRWKKLMDNFSAAARKEIENNSSACCGGYNFYIIKARKPS